jgi:hypothetical protein
MAAIIQWSKRYFEELGELDQDGFYEFAYRYFIYTFYLPDKHSLVIRNYTDTALEGDLFIYRDKKFDKEYKIDNEPLIAVLRFLYTKHGVSRFTRFDGEYRPIDLNELKSKVIDFSFVEIAATE